VQAAGPAVVWAIVVAAGSGSRFGGPKQYERLGDSRVLDWSVRSARSVATGVVLAVGADDAGRSEPDVDLVVAGGASRSASVRAALAVVPERASVIVVHDAARPLASPALFAAVVDAVEAGAEAAVPGVALADTVKRVAGGRVVATLERAALVAVQTPQAFDAAALRQAHATGGSATDDAALVEATGGVVVVVPGEVRNLKVTTRDDLEQLRRWVAEAEVRP